MLENLHNKHDKGYKYLLSTKRLFEDIELIDKSFILQDFKLPVIIPCVLYNGKQRWTAEKNFRKTLSQHEMFGDLVIDFQYLLFDVKRYDDEDLLKLSNVIASAFFVDKTNGKGQETVERLKSVAQNVQSLSDDDRDVFCTWVKNIVSRGLPIETKKEIDDIFEKEGKVVTMVYALEQIIRKEMKEARIQGLTEGKMEGKIEGKMEGKREEKMFIAQNMIQKGLDDEMISDLTGLSKEEIFTLRNQKQ